MAEKERTLERNLQTAEKILVRASKGRKKILGLEISCIIDELTKRQPDLAEPDLGGITKLSKMRQKIEARKVI